MNPATLRAASISVNGNQSNTYHLTVSVLVRWHHRTSVQGIQLCNHWSQEVLELVIRGLDRPRNHINQDDVGNLHPGTPWKVVDSEIYTTARVMHTITRLKPINVQ